MKKNPGTPVTRSGASGVADLALTALVDGEPSNLMGVIVATSQRAQFENGDVCAVAQTGAIRVKVEEAVAPGDPCFIDTDTGDFYKTAASGRSKVIEAVFNSTAAADGVAELQLNGPPFTVKS